MQAQHYASMSETVGEKAEGKNDNNDNTAQNGMKSESEKVMGFNVFISLELNLESRGILNSHSTRRL